MLHICVLINAHVHKQQEQSVSPQYSKDPIDMINSLSREGRDSKEVFWIPLYLTSRMKKSLWKDMYVTFRLSQMWWGNNWLELTATRLLSSIIKLNNLKSPETSICTASIWWMLSNCEACNPPWWLILKIRMVPNIELCKPHGRWKCPFWEMQEVWKVLRFCFHSKRWCSFRIISVVILIVFPGLFIC